MLLSSIDDNAVGIQAVRSDKLEGYLLEELQGKSYCARHNDLSYITIKNDKGNYVIEYNLKLDSNPEFTACVLIAYARAAYRLANEGVSGCKTVFDIPPAYLSSLSHEEIISHLL